MTKIEWTHIPGFKGETWNPGLAGCSIASKGCKNCYAKYLAHRWANSPHKAVAKKYKGTTRRTPQGNIQWTGNINIDFDHPSWDQPHRWKKPRAIFVNSMSDCFHEWASYPYFHRIFEAAKANPQHIFMILTKRSQRMREYCKCFWQKPLPNVWLGVSVEDQEAADQRIPDLIDTPAAIRFLSCEPLIGPIDLTPKDVRHFDSPDDGWLNELDWIIVGGESGRNARPIHPDWVTSIRDRCIFRFKEMMPFPLPFFFKQWGAWLPLQWDKEGDCLLHCNDKKSIQRQKNSTHYHDWEDFPINLFSVKLGKKKAGRILGKRVFSQFPNPENARITQCPNCYEFPLTWDYQTGHCKCGTDVKFGGLIL